LPCGSLLDVPAKTLGYGSSDLDIIDPDIIAGALSPWTYSDCDICLNAQNVTELHRIELILRDSQRHETIPTLLTGLSNVLSLLRISRFILLLGSDTIDLRESLLSVRAFQDSPFNVSPLAAVFFTRVTRSLSDFTEIRVISKKFRDYTLKVITKVFEFFITH